MRLICPNCEQASDLDTGPLSATPARSSCPGCGVRFEIVLLVEPAPAPASSTVRGTVSQRGVACAGPDDVLSLPRPEVLREAHAPDPSSVLDLDEAPAAHAPAPPRAPAPDRYGLAVRLMNVSPLWLLAAGLAFVSLALGSNWLITGRTNARAGVAALRNEATNRSAPRAPRADEPAEQNTTPPNPPAPNVGYSAELRPPDAQQQASAAPPEAVETPSADESRRPEVAEVAAVPDAAQPAVKFTIQTGSYRLAEEAEKQAEGLRAAGFEARVVGEQPAKRVWYCVQTGLFDTRPELETHLARLREKGLAAGHVVREIK